MYAVLQAEHEIWVARVSQGAETPIINSIKEDYRDGLKQNQNGGIDNPHGCRR
jgi:hypothetical protein